MAQTWADPRLAECVEYGSTRLGCPHKCRPDEVLDPWRRKSVLQLTTALNSVWWRGVNGARTHVQSACAGKGAGRTCRERLRSENRGLRRHERAFFSTASRAWRAARHGPSEHSGAEHNPHSTGTTGRSDFELALYLLHSSCTQELEDRGIRLLPFCYIQIYVNKLLDPFS
jgi:hypothetical protein